MKKLCLLLALLISCGCAHTPSGQTKQAALPAKQELSAAAVTQTIVKGKTTREEIVAAFGPPNSVAKNTALPSKEMLAKAKGPLPPIARTVEFWNYWTVPPAQEVEKSAATGTSTNVFRLMIFMDANGVAVDYVTEERKVGFTQPGN